MDGLGEAAARVRSTAQFHPLPFDGIVEVARRPVLQPRLTDFDPLPALAAHMTRVGFTIARNVGIQIDEMSDPVGDVFERSGDDETAIRKADQDNVPKVLVQHVIDDIPHMGAQSHQRTGQMHALSDAGETWREHLVSVGLQNPPDMPETVGAAKGAMYQDEDRHSHSREFKVILRSLGADQSVER